MSGENGLKQVEVSRVTGRSRKRVGPRCGGQIGQATAEYAILTLWTVIILLATFEALRFALLNYYYDIASLISLPIP